MPRFEMPDADVVIEAFRGSQRLRWFMRYCLVHPVLLSDVVVAELYAGADTPEKNRRIDALVQGMELLNRLVTPERLDWQRAGRSVQRRLQNRGERVRLKDHLPDLLIALTAGRQDAALITSNQKHMDRWAELAAGFGLQIAVKKKLRYERGS